MNRVILSKIGRYVSLANDMSKKEFKNKYYGSFLGITWAFIHPVITIAILWFVFQVGFKSTPINDVPFILWLATGMVPWFFISEVLSNGPSAISENTYLVKKVVFKIEILPLVKVLTSLKIHIFFIGILLIIYFIYGYELNIHNLQLVYFIMCSVVFTSAINMITSALNVFLKDVGQIIALIVQFGFWVTPIFWNLSMVPEKYHFLIKLNPVYYIVEGYRMSLLTSSVISDFPNLAIFFWIVTIVLLAVGCLLFNKLKPHFADVL